MPVALLTELGTDTPRRWRTKFEHRVVFEHGANAFRRTITVEAYHGQEALELALEELTDQSYDVAKFELVTIDRVRSVGGGSWL